VQHTPPSRKADRFCFKTSFAEHRGASRSIAARGLASCSRMGVSNRRLGLFTHHRLLRHQNSLRLHHARPALPKRRHTVERGEVRRAQWLPAAPQRTHPRSIIAPCNKNGAVSDSLVRPPRSGTSSWECAPPLSHHREERWRMCVATPNLLPALCTTVYVARPPYPVILPARPVDHPQVVVPCLLLPSWQPSST
jgi:hypothetical protein